MTDEPQSLGDMIAEDEERMLAKGRAEIAAETAAWRALSDEQRAERLAEQEARWDALDAACSEADNDNEDEEDEE